MLYGIGGLVLGGLGVYVAIKQGWIASPAPAPVVARVRAPIRARVPMQSVANTQSNGRQFGGVVTALNVPTQYARAGIGARAQAFESPEHADLIRVD